MNFQIKDRIRLMCLYVLDCSRIWKSRHLSPWKIVGRWSKRSWHLLRPSLHRHIHESGLTGRIIWCTTSGDFNEGQCDRGCWRCCLLSHLKSHLVGSECRRCSSLHKAIGSDNLTEWVGNEESEWFVVATRHDKRVNCKDSGCGDRSMGNEGGTSRSQRCTSSPAITTSHGSRGWGIKRSKS